jgi:multiple sugar transport system permease protein
VPAVGQFAPAGESSPQPGWSLWPHHWLLRFLGYGGRPMRQTSSEAVGSLHAGRTGHWQFDRYMFAYLLLLPALGSIALWAYYPLARGTTIAFQDYNVRGFSQWVGLENFANVLFDDAFWHAMWTSLKYAILYMTFGFFAPIILAFLLTEVPRGKMLYRTIFYLPAVLSGAVVIFLWKGFYSGFGVINQFLNMFVNLANSVFGTQWPEIHKRWLEDPTFALFCCILPTIWAGMGPGCLIYLAALKTIPDEFYEAAEIDGAGIWHKLRHVAYPGIRALVAINFIGAVIGTIHGGSEMVLAMTGGGPYAPYGASEVVGLHIFWQTFGYLRFGPATAMAWILGAMLIGFTVMQLTRLSKMEFRRAGATDPNSQTGGK